MDVPMSSPSTAITARGAGVGATKALVESSEQAVTVPSMQAFLPLLRPTDLISGLRRTMATSLNTGMATRKPVAASAAAEFFLPQRFSIDVAMRWQALDFSR